MPKRMVCFQKILNIKFDGLSGRFRKYRFRYNLIVFICFKGSVKHNIKVSGSFTVIFYFLQPLEFDFSAKFTKRLVKNNFFLGPTKF